MANLNSMSFSLLFLAIFILLANQTAAIAPPGINPFCKTATSKRLCTKMVKGATNLHDATLNAIDAALYVAKKIQSLTPVIVKTTAGIDPGTKSQVVQTCSESFENSLEDLGMSRDLLNQGDMGGVGTRLSAAYSFNSDCTDSLEQSGANSLILDKLMKHFSKVMDNSLAVAFQN